MQLLDEKASEQSKQKMSAVKSGVNNPMYGRKQSEETKQKIKESLTGVKRSDEYIEKLRERMKGNIPWNKGLHNRPIVCLDANIQFSCCEEATEWIGGITPEAIQYVLKRKACCKSHVFAYADSVPEDVEEYIKQCLEHYRKGSKAGRPCRCIEDNLMFKYISEAAKYYDLTHSVVWSRIKTGKDAILADGRIIHFENISHEEFESLKCKKLLDKFS